ncbi:MAG: EVE domain-containing protein [Pseudomonadota bacterium]
MKRWLVKTEPSVYSWTDLVREGRTFWDGVRNYQARGHLAAMKTGDMVLIYHSVKEKSVVGIARAASDPYPDPTAAPGEPWVVVDLEPVAALPRPVSLSVIKNEPTLLDLPLLRQSRLSVMPLTEREYNRLVELGGREAALKKETT